MADYTNFTNIAFSGLFSKGAAGAESQVMNSAGSLVGTPIVTGLTASRALVSDSTKAITSSTVTSTEIGYLSGVTSNIQTQINSATGASAPTAYSNAVATAFGFKEYVHGTTYNGTSALAVTSDVAGFTATKCSLYPYQDQAGSWYLQMNLQMDYSGSSHQAAHITISGITYANEGNNGWPLSAMQGNDTTTYPLMVYAQRNNATISYKFSIAIAGLSFAIQGWAKLTGKPTWAY